jgi:DNA-binding MarR family transcriptional regulator
MNQNMFSNALQEWAGVFARRTIHDFMAFAHQYGLSMPHITVLMRLYYRGPASILAVRQDLYGSRASASQLVDKLVQMNLIERSEAPEDRRVKRIRLTDQGHAVVEQGIAARREWLGGLAQSFTEEEQVQFAAMLTRITRAAIDLEARDEPAALDETEHLSEH